MSIYISKIIHITSHTFPDQSVPPSHPSSINPVVGFINCEESIEGYFGNPADAPHYYKLITSKTYDVTFSDCNTSFDSELVVYDSFGEPMMSSIWTDCDGDDCIAKDCTDCYDCVPFVISRENFKIKSLPIGEYYVKMGAHKGEFENGIYMLSVTCTLSNISNNIYLYPTLGGTTSGVAVIASPPGDNDKQIHTLYVHSIGGHCINPTISVSFEETAYNRSITHFTVNFQSQRPPCTGRMVDRCGIWLNCLHSHSLNISQINASENKSISVTATFEKDLLCTYSLHVRLKILCSDQPSATTRAPSNDHAYLPTIDPTHDFTNDPTNPPTEITKTDPKTPMSTGTRLS